MKYHDVLKSVKCVISAEALQLSGEIDNFFDLSIKKKMRQQLKKVEVYRIIYKIKQLKVVGYIVLPKEGDSLPCLLHLRGGSRDFGMIVSRGILANMVNYAAEGYVVITTQYPGVEGGDGLDTYGGEDDLLSIKKLHTILKEIPQADEKNVGVKGHSRGGLMAYMLMREVKWVKAATANSAPTDQVDRVGDREGWQDHQKRMWGGDKTGTIRRSPVRWVDDLPRRIPLLIMHGSSDWRVLPRHSFNMVEELRKRNHPHRFIFFEGADHGITEYRSEYHRQTLDWFNRWLKNKEPLPNMKPHGR